MEHDGSTYSCDHFVYPEYRLGTLREKSLAEMAFSRTQVKFGYAKFERLPRYCRECAYLNDCWGECQKIVYFERLTASQASIISVPD